jgi:D-tyrosyl-tRNA(Tyr) deacylase
MPPLVLQSLFYQTLMKLLVQRVTAASVRVNGELVSEIGPGYLILIGVGVADTRTQADYLADKLLNLRILADDAGKMNRSITDTKGELLVVSQFTLYGDTRNGRRPGFAAAAPPQLAQDLYEYFVARLRDSGLIVKTGIFQADMQVALVNDGPVTFLLES